MALRVRWWYFCSASVHVSFHCINRADDELRQGEGDTDLEVTGLSGIEDIVGEIIAKGDIDPHSVGLTEQQAQKISEKVR